MKEIERIFLARRLPPELESCKKKEIIDVYFPSSADHPVLRLRKNGDVYEMTKKEVLYQEDKTVRREQTISLTEEEFKALSSAKGKVVHKIRYQYPYRGKTLEIGVFQGALKGLVTIDVEFKDEKERDSFAIPDFCLADVTQAGFLAGGLLCGKSYKDVMPELEKYDYKSI